MCGIIGVYNRDQAIDDLYQGLLALQHRGQDAAGIVTFDEGLHLKKGNGLVQRVFNDKNLARLKGDIGIGHVRYPTVGAGMAEDAQPFIVNNPFGIALAHNGNLVNYLSLRQALTGERFRYINSDCDAEVILNVLADELSRENLRDFSPALLFRALKRMYEKLLGSYAAVVTIAGKGILAFRDPHGIKPLVFGSRGGDYAFASESVAFDLLGFNLVGDIGPGQAVFIDGNRKTHLADIEQKKPAVCIFEYVYFARPDSVIDGIGVYEARLRLGEELGRECRRHGLKPDVVIPVPDTARGSAQMVAEVLGTTHREGLIKNRYIYRTFIMPTQHQRTVSIHLKLNPIKSEVAGKKVLVVDDSIVRGNTSREIVSLIRRAGAREVYFASYSPPLRSPCVYGIDMQTRGEFAARERNNEEIRQMVGCDRLVYQTVEGMVRAVGVGRDSFCTGCFTGQYPTEVPGEALEEIERSRAACRVKVESSE